MVVVGSPHVQLMSSRGANSLEPTPPSKLSRTGPAGDGMSQAAPGLGSGSFLGTTRRRATTTAVDSGRASLVGSLSECPSA